jgi:ATP-dependent Lon protease
VTLVIAPARNEADADDIPEHLRRRLKFSFVDEIGEVLDLALERSGHGYRVRELASVPR